MNGLDQSTARRIIEQVGGTGQPPQYGLQFFSVGLEKYLSVIDNEYLSGFIRDGGSAFKMVVGVYGGGKTHFLYSVRDLAWNHNFAVSYVSLKSSGECPFYQLDLVYKAVVNGLVPPLPPEELMQGYQPGIDAFLRAWYGQKVREYRGQGLRGEEEREAISEEIKQIGNIASVSFGNAIRSALTALQENRETTFEAVTQWLKGEGYDPRIHKPHKILQRIDRTTAFSMIRSLGQTVRQLGYNGLIILLDEAERVPSLSTRQREQHLSNLREIIDECGHTTFQGMMLFYAVPDENFLEGRTQVYEALKQRLSTTFNTINPAGVKIELERTVADPIPFLTEVGEKLVKVYEVAYNRAFEQAAQRTVVQMIAAWAHDQRFQDEGYKRLFLQKLVNGLHFLRSEGKPPTMSDLG